MTVADKVCRDWFCCRNDFASYDGMDFLGFTERIQLKNWSVMTKKCDREKWHDLILLKCCIGFFFSVYYSAVNTVYICYTYQLARRSSVFCIICASVSHCVSLFRHSVKKRHDFLLHIWTYLKNIVASWCIAREVIISYAFCILFVLARVIHSLINLCTQFHGS